MYSVRVKEREREREREKERKTKRQRERGERERESVCTLIMWVCFVFLQSVPFCLFVCGVFALNFGFQSFVKLCHDVFVAS
jgi:ABC-type Fe3+ transport system permease subunit